MSLPRIAAPFLIAVVLGHGCRGPEPPSSDAHGERVATPRQTNEGGDHASAVPPEPTEPSVSVRNPNDGLLRGGVPLPLTAPGLRFNPRNDPNARYGTEEVVAALVDSARLVHEELGGLPVTINDLSYREGGPIPRHASHQSGRDVDVLFYQLDTNSDPIPSVGAFFNLEGAGVDFHDLADPSDDVPLWIDLPRTWRFLQALIENPNASLQSIYVAEHIRTLLLRYARSAGVEPATVARFAAMTCQPEYPHDDHVHLRFYCAIEDIAEGCRDSKPLYPWRRRALKKAGVAPLPLLPKRPGAEAKTISHEEARANAGELDAEVERWLDERQDWIAQPHPGRRFCR